MGFDRELAALRRKLLLDPDDEELRQHYNDMRARLGLLPDVVFFVYRHTAEPLGKRLVQLPVNSVLGWFQSIWSLPAAREDPRSFLHETFSGEVHGFAALFEAIAKYSLKMPKTWQELRKHLRDHIEGAWHAEDVQMDEHSLRIQSGDGEEKLAYYFFDLVFAESHPERVAFLLHDRWKLPQSWSEGEFHEPLRIERIGHDSGGEGVVYFLSFSSYTFNTFHNFSALRIDGLRLAELCSFLRQTKLAKTGGNGEEHWAWPFELRLLRALIEDDEDLETALKRMRSWPVAEVMSYHLTDELGLGSHDEAQLEVAALARQLGVEELRDLPIAVGEHCAQLGLEIILFDDRWAALNSELAASALRCARSWDALK